MGTIHPRRIGHRTPGEFAGSRPAEAPAAHPSARSLRSRETRWASLQKTIYSLPALRELPEAANRRYLEFLSAIEDPRAGRNKLDKLSQSVEQEGRRYSGFNLFDREDEKLLCSIVRGEFNISGLQNKTLRRHLPKLNSGQVSRLLKRLRTHGLVKKVGHTYKYYVTSFGKEVVATALKLRELVIIPGLATAA